MEYINSEKTKKELESKAQLLQSNPKKAQLKEEWATDVERKNRILVEKMSDIVKRNGRYAINKAEGLRNSRDFM